MTQSQQYNFNHSNIEAKLAKKPSITTKLDYWIGIQTKYINDELSKIELTEEKNKFLFGLFGEDFRRITWDFILPESIYNSHFSKNLNNPELTFWFLKYNANWYYSEVLLPSMGFDKYEIDKATIEIQLKKLNEFDEAAEALLQRMAFTIDDYNYNSKYSNECELIRIKRGYYKDHTFQYLTEPANKTIILYAKHVYFKEFLGNKLEPQQNNESIKELCNDLNNHYFKVSTLEIFVEIMKYKRLPNNAEKIIWLTCSTSNKVEAMAFQEHFGFTIKAFNDCFKSQDNITFHGKQKGKPKKKFKDLLAKYQTHSKA